MFFYFIYFLFGGKLILNVVFVSAAQQHESVITVYIYIYTHTHTYIWLSQVALVISNTPANAGDLRDAGSILGSGGSPGGGHGNPLQYSCLENPMHRGVWWATVHRVVKSRTRPSDLAHVHIHPLPPNTHPQFLKCSFYYYSRMQSPADQKSTTT